MVGRRECTRERDCITEGRGCKRNVCRKEERGTIERRDIREKGVHGIEGI